MRVHRIVAINFLPNINNSPEINHIDHNKSNNNIKNLEWVTSSENSRKYIDMLYKNGGRIGKNFGNKVINTDTKVIYESVKEASIKEGVYLRNLHLKLRGIKFNDTNLKYFEIL